MTSLLFRVECMYALQTSRARANFGFTITWCNANTAPKMKEERNEYPALPPLLRSPLPPTYEYVPICCMLDLLDHRSQTTTVGANRICVHLCTKVRYRSHLLILVLYQSPI